MMCLKKNKGQLLWRAAKRGGCGCLRPKHELIKSIASLLALIRNYENVQRDALQHRVL